MLGSAQLASVLSDVGFGPVPFDRMFDLFDADGNGKVTFGSNTGYITYGIVRITQYCSTYQVLALDIVSEVAIIEVLFCHSVRITVSV